jgi:cephalosporin-C deacetylase-like acetyl esterase
MDKLKFKNLGKTIRGYFFPARKYPPIASLVFLQGFPGVEGNELICEQLAQKNVNVLTFNYQGTFQSEGYFSFSNAIGDIKAAIQFISKKEIRQKYDVDIENLILGGWSFGSGIVPAGAASNPEVSKILCISGRDFGAEARRIEQSAEYADEVLRNLVGIRVPNGPVNFEDDILEDLIKIQEKIDVQNLAHKMVEHEILLIGGWEDKISLIEEHLIPLYRTLIKIGNKRVRIEALKTDHEFSNCRDRLVEIIVEWIRM